MWDSVLAQLLFNAIPGLASGERMYHNVTGGLYYLRPSWMKRKKGEFYALKIQLTWDYCLTLHVKTFCRTWDKEKTRGKPRYLLDSQSGMLRRVLKSDPDEKQAQYEQKARDRNSRNNVEFLGFGSLSNFEDSRMGMLDRFLQDVSELLDAYLTIHLTVVDETTHGERTFGTSVLNRMTDLLGKQRVVLEDTIEDRCSASLRNDLTDGLRNFYAVAVQEGTPEPGDVLIRIVHEPEYYKENPEEDPYGTFPEGCTVQHVTLENFLTERKALPKQDKADPYLHKVVQELGIKLDIQKNQLQFYDWTGLRYERPLVFVAATRCEKKSQHYIYDRLEIAPDGGLSFDSWDNLTIPQTPDWLVIETAFQTKNKKVDLKIKGIFYEDVNRIHVIRDTDQFTVPNLEELKQRLRDTRPDELLDVAELRQVLQDQMTHLTEKEQTKCRQWLMELEPLGKTAARKEIKEIISLRSNLGRSVNGWYYEKTGKWLGRRMKDAESLEKLFSGLLDIRFFTQDRKWYYYSGYLAKSLQSGVSRACLIREISAPEDDFQLERYLPLMAVDFVRTACWIVIPFPFKYLREWRRSQKPKGMQILDLEE